MMQTLHENSQFITGLEVLTLLFGACIVAENVLMLFTMKDARRILKPMRLLVCHLAIVYMLYGFFSINATSVQLINSGETNVALCYMRGISRTLLENVATYGSLWLVVCCPVLAQSNTALRSVFCSGHRLALLLVATWGLMIVGTVLTFTVGLGENGSVCHPLRGYSRTVCVLVESSGMLLLTLSLGLQLCRMVRGVRPVSPDVMLLSDEHADATFSETDENTMTLLGAIFLVIASAKLGFDISYSVKVAGVSTTEQEYTWHVVAKCLWHLNGILLLPVLLVRHPEVRRMCGKTLTKKWNPGTELSRNMDDDYYRRSTVCRRALSDPHCRRVTMGARSARSTSTASQEAHYEPHGSWRRPRTNSPPWKISSASMATEAGSRKNTQAQPQAPVAPWKIASFSLDAERSPEHP